MLYELLDIESANILVMDNDGLCLGFLTETLASHGFRNLHAFQNPENAIASYRAGKPDLVLLDSTLPELTILAVLRLFQETIYFPAPPVLVLTADSNRHSRLSFLKHGAKDFMHKPIDVEELLCRVKNLLQMHMAHTDSLRHSDVLDGLVENRTSELLITQKEILQRLGSAAEFKDKDTYWHTQRVGCFAACLTKTLGFNEQVVEDLLLTAPLHDVGKIGVPDQILFKPGKLEADEWEQMKLHTTHGYNILKGSNSRLLKIAEIIALTHHERWDGAGYPYHLKYTDIHIYGRITAIADVYDALTMARPYKKAWTYARAAALILQERGKQFDPELVDAFATVQDKFVSIAASFNEKAAAQNLSGSFLPGLKNPASLHRRLP